MKGHWVGLNEANAALKRLPEHVRDPIQQVMDTTAFQLARKIESGAPERTGNLKRSIQWKSNQRWLSALVGIERGAFYWKFPEYGTVKMPARPFVRPAAASLAADHEARLLRALDQGAQRMEQEAA